MEISATSPHSTALIVHENSATMEQTATRIFLRSSYKAHFADHHYFHRHGMGTVIALIGTSTAGKTSIIKELQKIEPGLVENGIDLQMDTSCIHLLKSYYPNETALLEQVLELRSIPRAIFTPERPWKPGISPSEQEKAIEILAELKQKIDALPNSTMDHFFQHVESQMIDSAFEHSRQGQNIVFDALTIDELAQSILRRGFNGPITTVLVYCPFHLLSERMSTRNREAQESGHLANQRVGTFPFIQFGKIYTHTPQRSSPLERITRDQAIKTFTENDVHKAGGLQEFLDDLGFTEGVDEVFVSPRTPSSYDVLINSGEISPKESAKFLHTQGKY